MKPKEINEIELVLENCDSVIIPGDGVLFYRIFDITKSIVADYKNSVPYERVLRKCKAFEIGVAKESKAHLGFNESTKWVERIKKYKDITAVVLRFKDGSTKTYDVDWSNWVDADKHEGQEVAIFGDSYIVYCNSAIYRDTFKGEYNETY